MGSREWEMKRGGGLLERRVLKKRVCYWGVYRGSCYSVCMCIWSSQGGYLWGRGDDCRKRILECSGAGRNGMAQVHFGLRSRDSLSIVIGEKAEMQVGPWIWRQVNEEVLFWQECFPCEIRIRTRGGGSFEGLGMMKNITPIWHILGALEIPFFLGPGDFMGLKSRETKKKKTKGKGNDRSEQGR